MIIQSRNVWHRWTSFLKETKLESWKGWKLSWRNLCSLCLLTQCASSCLFVRVTFFYSTVCVWQWRRDHKRRQFYWVTSFIQWASQFPGSLRKAPAALSANFTRLSVYEFTGLSGDTWCAGYSGCFLRSHTLPSTPQNYIDLKRNFEMSSSLYSKCLDCLFHVHLIHGIYYTF